MPLEWICHFMMKQNLGEGHLVGRYILYIHTHIKKKKIITLAQIKLKDQGFSHLVTFWVGPFGAAGGHKEDTFQPPPPPLPPDPAVGVEDGVCGDICAMSIWMMVPCVPTVLRACMVDCSSLEVTSVIHDLLKQDTCRPLGKWSMWLL